MCLMIFIVVMDVLKYGFGIDPVDRQAERSKKVNAKKNRITTILRFIYVNPPSVVVTKADESIDRSFQ